MGSFARDSGIEIRGHEVALAVIVAAFQDRTGPLTDEHVGGAADGEFDFPGFGVEEHDFAQAAADEGFLIDGQFCQSGEEFALDVVGREGAVGEGFEKEAHRFQEVVLRVDDGVLDVPAVTVEQAGDVREEFELVHRGTRGLGGAGGDIGFGSFSHADAKVGDFFVGHAVEVL